MKPVDPDRAVCWALELAQPGNLRGWHLRELAHFDYRPRQLQSDRSASDRPRSPCFHSLHRSRCSPPGACVRLAVAGEHGCTRAIEHSKAREALGVSCVAPSAAPACSAPTLPVSRRPFAAQSAVPPNLGAHQHLPLPPCPAALPLTASAAAQPSSSLRIVAALPVSSCMERSASGELDAMPGKRKAPGPSSRAPLHTGPAETTSAKSLASATAGCTPAMSSPAIGAWGLHDSSECQAEPGCESCFCDTAGSLRGGKALRVCSDAAAAAAAAAAGAADSPAVSPTAGEGRPLSCQGGSRAALGACSLPPGMYRSFHLGCCSRLSSSSSLAELEAATAAATLGSGKEDDDPATAGTAGVASTTAAKDIGAAAAAEQEGCPTAAAGAADVTAAGLAAAAASRPQQPSWPPPSPVCGRAQQGQLAWRQSVGREEANGASCWHDIPDDILRRVRNAWPACGAACLLALPLPVLASLHVLGNSCG